MNADEMLKLHARKISDSLDTFSANEKVFSSSVPRLVDRYEDKWVGVFHGRVVVAEDTLESVTSALMAKGIPLGDAMIRRIDREEKTLIL